MMTTPMRSATVLMQKALSEPETLDALRADPAQALKELEREVVATMPAALPSPPPKFVGWLWLIIVSTFALVLLYTAWVLGNGVTTPLREEANYAFTGQSMLTVFTAVVGFLSGLLAPSPMGSKDR